jgi:predicted N-acyltransferase
MTIDLAELADPRLAWVIRRMPGLWRLQRLKILFCGLPGTPGAKSLALAQTRDGAQMLSRLDEVADELARESGMDAIVYKEFGEADLQWMNSLLERGYRRFAVPPMHVFRHSFADFAQYCTALKTRYRQQINRSLRKLTNAGIDQLVLTDREEILKLYTPEVHALYCQMVARSEVQLELLPIEYFRQLTSRLGAEADLIALAKGSRIVAFGWGLRDGPTYHLTYAGLDYRLNQESDLYFNLMYTGFDRAFRKGAATINAGQTAGAFKARIGCDSAPLYAFGKGLGPMMSRLFSYGANLLVARTASHAPANVFKDGFGSQNRLD